MGETQTEPIFAEDVLLLEEVGGHVAVGRLVLVVQVVVVVQGREEAVEDGQGVRFRGLGDL